MDFLKKSCIWCNQKVLSILKVLTKMCNRQRSIYGLVQASRSWNICFDELIKAYSFIQTFGEACIYKKMSGSSVAFLILYMDDILLIGNDTEFLDSVQWYLHKNFSMKDLGEAAYILGIKIYRDRSRCLINFSTSTYLTSFWSTSKWNSQRRSSWLCCKVWSWVKTQNPTMAENRKRMKSHSLCLICSIKYVMLWTNPIVYHAMSLARGRVWH